MSLHVGDVGAIIELTIVDGATPINVAAATTKEIVLRPPSGAKVTKAAAFTTSGTDGKIRVTTVSTDLSVAGNWQAEAHIIMPGEEFRTDAVSFVVQGNL